MRLVSNLSRRRSSTTTPGPESSMPRSRVDYSSTRIASSVIVAWRVGLASSVFFFSSDVDAQQAARWIWVEVAQNCKDALDPQERDDAPKLSPQRQHFVDEPRDALWNAALAKPLTHNNSRSGVTLYVESDGRHVAAFNSKGKWLWTRDPFEDARLCPHRTPRPVVEMFLEPKDYLGKDYNHRWGRVSARNIAILRYDSSQTIFLDELTGYVLGLDSD